ncbi:MAG: hypothetical protein NC131_01640 [Roseburia sp.]|nr:hypothetical protein [Roseburia sp.]
MKRFFVVFLPLLSITLLCACSSEPSDRSTINFTADTPKFCDTDLTSKKQIIGFENRATEDNYDVYADFTSYYTNNIKDKIVGDFYLLNPGDGLTGWVPHYLDKAFYLFADEENEYGFSNPLILEDIFLYDTALDKSNEQSSEIIDGKVDWNIQLHVILPPVTDITGDGNNLIFEFGNNYADETYVNIYCEQTCVATCFYKTKVNLSYNWFADYFNTNLLKEK